MDLSFHQELTIAIEREFDYLRMVYQNTKTLQLDILTMANSDTTISLSRV